MNKKLFFPVSISRLVILTWMAILLMTPSTTNAAVHGSPNGAVLQSNLANEINIDGSPVVAPVLQTAHSQFISDFPDTAIDPITSTSSLHGILSLLYDAPYTNVNVAMSAMDCNGLNPVPISGKRCSDLTSNRIGMGAVEVVVNPSKNCVGSLTRQQLIYIWEGNIKNWHDLNSSCPDQAIVPRAEDLSSDTRILFNRKTGIDEIAEENTIYYSGWPRLATDAEMEQAIKDHEDQIGYTVGNGGPLDPTPPQATTSRYMDSVDYRPLYNLGQKRGGCGSSHIQPTSDDLLILDFGQPYRPDEVYIWGSNPIKKNK